MSSTKSASETRPRDLCMVPPCGRALASYQQHGRRANCCAGHSRGPRCSRPVLRRRSRGRSVQSVTRAFIVRPFRSADLDGALAANDAVGWTGRRVLFDYYSARDDCALFVAEADGEIVGTGSATIFPGAPPTGWVHGIVVRPGQQRSGLGRRLTEAAIAWLRARSAGAVLLLATEAGSPVYERIGFVAGERYGSFAWPPTSAGGISADAISAGANVVIRPMRAGDLH